MKIFISHSFKDSDVADIIRQNLTNRNIDVIQIEQEQKVGDNIVLQIENAVHESDAYIILLSKNYTSSKVDI